MKSRLSFLLAACALAYLTLGCGGVKVNLVRIHQTMEVTLAAVDDAERVACFGTVKLPADPTVCTVPTAEKPLISKQQHHDLSVKLADAFAHQQALVPVLKGWTAHSLPPDLTTAISDANQISGILTAIGVPNVLAKVTPWLEALANLQKAIQEGRGK